MVHEGFTLGFSYRGWGWPSFHTWKSHSWFFFCGRLAFTFTWMSRCLLSIPPFGFRLQEDRGHAWCCLAVAPWHLAQSWVVPRANLTAGQLQCWEWDPGCLTLRWPAAFGIANPLPDTKSWVVCIKHSIGLSLPLCGSFPHLTNGCQPPCHMPPEQRERMDGLESWCKLRQRSLISNTWPSFQRQVQFINL